MKLRHAFIGAALLVGVSASAALAAGYGLWPTLPTVSAPYGLTGNEQVPADTGLANGAQPQTEYISVPQMRAVAYLQETPLTAFTITIPNGVSTLMLTPAGTLATGTVTMPAAPVDGQQVCLFSTQTQTALTLSANTGQTISNAITAMVADTQYCWVYAGTTANAVTAANWYRAR